MKTREQARAVVLVLDACGAGEAPDSAEFGDPGADTLRHTAEAVGGLALPNLTALGLGNVYDLPGADPLPDAPSVAGRLRELSRGKDTTVGHWELMGVVTEAPMPTYPEGFPQDILSAFVRRVGRGALCNQPASGTAVIEEFGEEHMRSGDLIVYTSADSVFQIAAHEEIIPLEELYDICRTARELLTGEHAVSRVIARPFVGSPGNFARTPNRKDFSLEPPGDSYATAVQSAGMPVIGVGKIFQIFAGKGIDEEVKSESNEHGMTLTIEQLDALERGLVFTNLVETDQVWGHRRDPHGFYRCLQQFDAQLPDLQRALRPQDLLIITADHGCDPTYRGTDHTRELVPLLAHSPGGNLRGRHDGYFSDVGATVCDWLGAPLPPQLSGTSFAAHAAAAASA